LGNIPVALYHEFDKNNSRSGTHREGLINVAIPISKLTSAFADDKG
jgi:hypothetical protein